MRIIAHLDMDAFFAAIEERDKPRLRGLPIVVGADPEGGKGRGVVSTANYRAREYGITSAMPISGAWRCSERARKAGKPPAVFIGGNLDRYGEISGEIMAIVRKYSSLVEQASIDEAYADFSHCGSFEKAAEAAQKLKDEIRKSEKLTATIGIGPNKLVAKIASDFKKPDGLTTITPEQVEGFLDPLPVRRIPGIGPKAESILKQKGIVLIRDLRRLSKKELLETFGSWGGGMYERARGKDDSLVEESHEVKSIGEQETFRHDTRDLTFIEERLKALASAAFKRFKQSSFSSFKTVILTVRFADFETKSRTHTLPTSTNDEKAIQFQALKLLMPFLDSRENPKRKPIRLIGVRVERFE